MFFTLSAPLIAATTGIMSILNINFCWVRAVKVHSHQADVKFLLIENVNWMNFSFCVLFPCVVCGWCKTCIKFHMDIRGEDTRAEHICNVQFNYFVAMERKNVGSFFIDSFPIECGIDLVGVFVKIPSANPCELLSEKYRSILVKCTFLLLGAERLDV